MKLSVLFLCGLLATFQGIQAVCTASSGGSPCSGSSPYCDLSLGASAACVQGNSCSASVPYGDPSTGSCVASCPAANPYVNLQHYCIVAGACTSTTQYTDAGTTPPACINAGSCSTNYPYQDSTARQCVAAGACVTTGQYTDAGTTPKACTNTGSCSTNYPYADPSTRSCVASCPAANPYVNLQHYCIVAGACTSTTQYTDAGTTPPACTNAGSCSTNYPYQDSTARQCVAAGACVTTGQYTDAGTTPKACTNTGSCSTNYPYADPSTKQCVAAGSCNSANAYQDPTTKKCVTATGCNSANPYSDAGASPKACVVATSCSSGLPYGDPTAKACVAAGACNSANAYQDPTTKTCVAIGSCNSANAYADPTPSPKVCVAATSCNTANPYGDPSTGKCVTTCPTGSTASATTKVCDSGLTPVSSSQSGAFSSTYLNSTAVKILNVGNTTGSDAKNWDSSATTNNGAGVGLKVIWFGAGATNDTSYLWGIPDSGYSTTTGVVSTILKRTINNTIVAWGNDTTEASVVSDTTVSASIQIFDSAIWTTGPGYLAAISSGTGTDGTNKQVWVSLVSGVAGSASSTKLTSTTDITSATQSATSGCTTTSFSTGDIWYDWQSTAFFYTYSKSVATQTGAAAGSSCGGSPVSVSTIYLGAIYANGSTYWAAPLAITPTTAANGVSSLMSGPDNSRYASNIYVVYKDTSKTPQTTYVSKTVKSTNTSSAGSPSILVADSSSGSVAAAGDTLLTYTYTPSSVWASNFTYGIGVVVENSSQTYAQSTANPATSTTVYSLFNYLNGTTTGTDSGLSIGSTGTAISIIGWQLNTGYSLLGTVDTSTATNLILGTFYGNGTVNMTAATVATFTYDYASFYEDMNGTLWVGWLDIDTANKGYVYAAYLAKFQGSVSIPSGANILSALSIGAVFLSSIFIF